MSLELLIRSSTWWQRAQETPDRHYDPLAGVTLAQHLEAVRRNLHMLQLAEDQPEYVGRLQAALVRAGFSLPHLQDLLEPVALLHDIGKLIEEKGAEGPHPITGETVRLRHPVLSLVAALELIPPDHSDREILLALVEEHDTPYAWYVQFQRRQQVQKTAAWARLDRRIDPRADGTGLMLLALFKLADIDGHKDLEDVPWFIQNANEHFLCAQGKELPVPGPDDLASFS
jgi:hypothetical protein